MNSSSFPTIFYFNFEIMSNAKYFKPKRGYNWLIGAKYPNPMDASKRSTTLNTMSIPIDTNNRPLSQ